MNSPGPIRVASVSAEVLPSAHLPAAASAPVSVQPASQLPPHCGYDFECLFCQESLPTASPLVISETEFRQHTRQSAYCYKKNLDHINEMMRQGNMEGDNPVANGQVKQQLVCRLCKDGGQINRYKLADLELVAHHMQRYHTGSAAVQASPASTPPSNPASVFVNQQRRSSGDLVTVGEYMQGVIEHQVPGAHVPRTSSPRVYNPAQTQAGYNMTPQSTHAQQIARAQHVLAQQPLQQRRSGPQPNSSMPAGRPVLGERRSQDSPVTQHYVQDQPVQNREIVMGMGNSPVEGRSGTPGGRNTASISGIAALLAQRGVGHGEVASVPEQDPEVIAAQPPVAFPAASPAKGPAQAAEQAPVDAAPGVVEQALAPNSVQVVADVSPPPAYHAAVAAVHMEGVRVTNRASGASVLAPDSSTSPDGEPAQNITSTKTGVEIIESVRAGGDDLADLSCDSDGNPVVSEDEPMPEPVKPCEVKMEPQPAAQHHDEFFFPDISRSAHAVLGEALSVETSIPAVTEQRCSSIDSTKENAMVDGLSVVTTAGRLPLRETAKNAVRQKIITRRWICKCGDSMESRDEFKRHYAKHQKVLPRSRSGVRYLCPRELCNYLAEDADDFATHVARHILLQHYYRMEKIKREAAEQLPSSKKK
ncbi:uncharacterized protein LOC129589386 isoform X2 [Paramacrobiotus metropolitanus]|uniref:uncharacterized protein LOC129589386 isoform X2 n=1 Tax=Paramacrobiotus metropolitanus TaxID=2943436 RepID=UPI002445FBD6|nr:uncharacterized protein LOC129589386 isoform X2 [Paramacrobiotus metropolitanus]